MNALIAFFARSPVAANVLMLSIVAIGLVQLMDMQRATFPDNDLGQVSVTVVYPGAAPEDLEESVARVVEERITGLDGLKETVSVCREGQATVTATFHEGTDTQEATNTIRNRVAAITTFPVGAEEPVVGEVEPLDLVAFCVLTGDMEETALREWAFTIKDRLIQRGIASKVQVDGVREREILVALDHGRLMELGLSVGAVGAAVGAATLDLPAGELETPGGDLLLRLQAKRRDPAAYAAIPVLSRPDGTVLTLGEVADIRWGFEDVPLQARYNGQRAVQVTVLKSADEDVITVDEGLQDFIREANGTAAAPGWLPAELELVCTFAWADLVRGRLDLLTKNGLIGLALVVLALWFFTEWRVAFWVAAGLPVALLGTLWLLDIGGQTINMISMFALIMALGILVDDAIIVAENIYARLEKGADPETAVVKGAQQVAIPVVGAVLTSVAAFLPMLMVPGRIGQFMMVLPITMAAGLAFSLIESFLILPRHLRHGMQDRYRQLSGTGSTRPALRRAIDHGLAWYIDRVVDPIVRTTVALRYLVLASSAALLAVSVGLVASGIVPFRFFPNPEGDILTVTLRFPVGTPLERVERQVALIEDALDATMAEFPQQEPGANGEPKPKVEHRTALLGAIPSPRGGYRDQGSHIGGVIVGFLPSEERNFSILEVQQRWNEVARDYLLPGLESYRIEETQGGPGGADIDIRFTAEDWDTLARVSDQMVGELADIDGVLNVNSDYILGKQELQLSLSDAGRSLGLTDTDLGRAVRNRFFGNEAVRFQRGRDEIVTRVILAADQRRSRADLEATEVTTADGRRIPLGEVAAIRPARSIATVNRFDRQRVVSVTAALTGETNTDQVLAQLGREPTGDFRDNSFFTRMRAEYGVEFLFEGVAATQAETMGGLMRGLVVAVVVIYLILVIAFSHWLQPLVIIAAIPMGIVGAIGGHLLLGINLTIISFFGIVGLAGIVVNDAITFVHFINSHRNDGLPLVEAVVQAVRDRFRPIMMTSATTVVGLLPLILERSLQAQFLIPMASAISFGLVASTVGTLVVVPALYVILFDLIGIAHWLRTGAPPLAHLDPPAGADERD